MDINRPDLKQKRKRRNAWLGGGLFVLLAVTTLAAVRLRPAVPTVDASSIWSDAVKRGSLTRQVRGIGTLTPREDHILLIPAQTDATVVRIRVLPGTEVDPDTVVMDLTDPRLEQELLDAQLQLKARKVEYLNLQVKLESDLMDKRSAAAVVNADYNEAKLQSETDKQLYTLGVISGLKYNASRSKAGELTTQNELENSQISMNQKAIASQLSVQQTKVEEANALLSLLLKEQSALEVHAGIHGVLVELPHQVGEHVAIGTTLAKVVQPDQLKAELKIPETQAHDVQLGMPAAIDTHNGVVHGHVMRIDPAITNGTRTVDIALDGSLPSGAVPDLSVDGTIDLQRLPNVLYTGRPAVGGETGTTSLFRIAQDGKSATRVDVKVGSASASQIQILEGLNEGDKIILSDMSRFDSIDKVRLE